MSNIFINFCSLVGSFVIALLFKICGSKWTIAEVMTHHAYSENGIFAICEYILGFVLVVSGLGSITYLINNCVI